MIENVIKDKLKQGKAVVGVLSSLGSAPLTEIFAIAGCEFIIIDMEHSTISEETLEGMVRASKLKGMVPFARVRHNDVRRIMGVLDAGCMGVMIPEIETKADAEIAARSTQYRPGGTRGVNWGTIAGEWGSITPADYLKSANETILNMIQIETAKGYENIEEIVKTPGIDVVILGPADLSASMGYPGNPKHPEVVKAIDKIIRVCKEAGIVVGGYGSTDREAMAELQKKGQMLFIIGAAAAVMESFKKLTSGIRETFL
jgi:2-keto-3-deoxy-L-rhamnonate aldolase RhmA